PPGLKASQVTAILQKARSGGFQSLSAEERAIMQQLRPAGGGRGPRTFAGANGESGGMATFRSVGGGGAGGGNSDYLFGGDYIVFVLRNGAPQPVPVRTGLTDLDYSEVLSGLTEQDTVLILPSASLIRQQQESEQRNQFMRNNALPGVQRQSQTTPAPGPVIITR
ncbi:MAG TPA: hypothetical protein VD793_07775, partial [Gemmatimonadales bacterium]|nr:hypothetical protein [Gemmatimonadales bacterium]